MTSSPLLQLDAISQRYARHSVVEQLSLSLQRGEIGCLLGSSGCGKTTVLRCIAGFEPLSGGRILIDGQLLADARLHTPAHKRYIGMVFQDYGLFPHLTVAGNVGFGLDALARDARAAQVARMLALVGLDGLAQRYPHELSGGQQQRVALARALAPQPRLLLLDEPFSNLDVSLRERLGQEVRDILKAAQATAILVTHDQHEAFAMADKVGVMEQGRIMQWDSPYNLYHQPANRMVADFIGQGVLLPGEVCADACIRIELGEACSLRPHGFAAGSRVEVLLRPDDVAHDDASPLRARVAARAFRGAEFLYTLALPSGQTVLSLAPSHHDHAIGEEIGVRLDAEHLVAFAV